MYELTISKSKAKYLLMVLGLLIFLMCYFLIFINYSDKTDALTTEMVTLKARLDVLKGYEAEIQKYETQIEEDKATIKETLSKYYSVETPEDFIMLAINMENEIDRPVVTLSFTEPETVYSIKAVTDTSDYTLAPELITLTSKQLSSTITSSMDYNEMKLALDYIAAQQDMTKLDSLNISYDASTGLISSSFVISKYFITGRADVNHQANVPYTELGKGVLIGS